MDANSTGMARYATWNALNSGGEGDIAWKDFVTKIADDYVGQEFVDDLDKFYSKAAPIDQAKCVELLASLTVNEGRQRASRFTTSQSKPTQLPKKQRPLTAMASTHGPKNRYGTSLRQGSEMASSELPTTTYYRSFPAHERRTTTQKRPRSTRNPFTDPADYPGAKGVTTTESEFYWKEYSKRETIPAGTASGARRNNPHPFEAFMAWKFPKKAAQQETPKYPKIVSNSMVQDIYKNKCKSTYQMDYLGLPQGYDIKSAYGGYSKSDGIKAPAYSLDSTTRFTYQPQYLPPPLRDEPGGYAEPYAPAIGVVPLISAASPLRKIKHRTTYDKFFGRNLPRGRVELARAIDSVNLEEFMKTASEQEKQKLSKMLTSLLNSEEIDTRRLQPNWQEQPGRILTDYALDRVSGWPGPAAGRI